MVEAQWKELVRDLLRAIEHEDEFSASAYGWLLQRAHNAVGEGASTREDEGGVRTSAVSNTLPQSTEQKA